MTLHSWQAEVLNLGPLTLTPTHETAAVCSHATRPICEASMIFMLNGLPQRILRTYIITSCEGSTEFEV